MIETNTYYGLKGAIVKVAMLLILTLVMNKGFAQSNSILDSVIMASAQASESKLIFLTDFEKAKDLARLDITKDKLKLFVVGGIASVVLVNDKDFESIYNIEYYDYGCIGPDEKTLQAYNNTVFTYLIKTFGKSWLKEIRPDVVGLKEYKKNR